MKKSVRKRVRSLLAALLVAIQIFMVLPVVAQADSGIGIDYWVEDSLAKVKWTAVKPEGASSSLDIHAARHDYEAQQLVLRSQNAFTINGVEFSNLTCGENTIDAENFKYNFLDYECTDTGFAGNGTDKFQLYPKKTADKYSGAIVETGDPLSNDSSRAVEANTAQPIFITLYAPVGTPAGTYTGILTVKTTLGDLPVDVSFKVYDATVKPVEDMKFTWYNWVADMGFSFQYSFDTPKLYYGIDRWTPEWWELMDDWTTNMLEHRQNMYQINIPQLLLDGGSTVDEDGTLHLNWSKFDEWLDFLIEKGFRRFGGEHLAFHWNGVDPNAYPGNGCTGILLRNAEGETVFGGYPVLDQDALKNGEVKLSAENEKYFRQFLPQLAEHLYLKKLPDGRRVSDVWLQHVFDEPNYSSNGEGSGKDKWWTLVETVHKYGVVKGPKGETLYQMRVFDADANGMFADKADSLDAWVPENGRLHEAKDFYKQLIERGDDVFGYICVAPGDPHMNRFTYMPVSSVQMLSWYGYQNGLSGILHWAWNVWEYGNGENGSVGRGTEGDSCIVYPDKENKSVKGSLRNEAMRDGLEDYSLFEDVEKRFGRDYAVALSQLGVRESNDYEREPAKVRAARELLLRAASGEKVDLNPGTPDQDIETKPGSVIINDTDPRIEYRNADGEISKGRATAGFWETDPIRDHYGWKAYQNDVTFSCFENYYVEFDFCGTGIEVYGEKNPDQGQFKLEIFDGETCVKTVEDSTKSETTREFIQKLASVEGLEKKQYTARITNLEDKYFTLDALVVLDYEEIADPTQERKINDTDASIRYTGDWGADAMRDTLGIVAMNNDAHYSNKQGAKIEITFTGSDLSLWCEQNSDQGKASVSIDGVRLADIDTYNETRDGANEFVIVKGLPNTRHTAEIVVQENKYFVLDAYSTRGVENAELAALWNALVAAKDCQKDQYTAESWPAFEAAYAAAVGAVQQADADHAAAAAALTAAQAGLVEKSDVTLRPTEITFDLSSHGARDAVVAMELQTGNALQAIMRNGEALTLGTDYTVNGSQVTLKADYLYTLPAGTYTLTFRFTQSKDRTLTVHTIGEHVVVDKTELAGYIFEAGKLDETAYTTESWTAMQKSLDDAEIVYNNEAATPEQVAAAVVALRNAIAALKLKADTVPPVLTIPADFELLVGTKFNKWEGVSAVDNVDGTITRLIQITGADFNVNQTGVYEVVYSITDQAGNNATKTLKVTVTEMTANLQKQALKALCSEYALLREEDYREGWSTFAEALKAAQALCEKDDATLEELTEAREALEAAKAAMVPRDKNDIITRPGDMIIDDHDPRITYQPEVGSAGDQHWLGETNRTQWYDAAYLDTVTYSTTTGDYLEVSFEGTGVSIYGERYRGQGDVELVITDSDGKEVTQDTFNTNAPADRECVVKLYTTQTLPYGSYKLRITNAENKYFTLDALVIHGTDAAPAEYEIVVEDDGHGTAQASKSKAQAGDVITLTARPDTGYHFKTWEVLAGDITIAHNQFTMPSKDVKVKAVFEADSAVCYTLTFHTMGGSAVQAVTAEAGTVIDLRRYVPVRAGYEFAGWYADAACTEKCLTVTLDEDTTVYAKWNKIKRPDPIRPGHGGSVQPSEPVKNPFVDVRPEDYCYEAVLWAVEQEITAGTSAYTFSPDAACTRAQAVTFLWRAEGCPKPAPHTAVSFTDVEEDAYYYEAMLWAVEQGIVHGTSAATFSPDADCDRSQIVTFLWRLAGAPEGANQGGASFADVADDAFYKDAVAWAVEQEITYGLSETAFGPSAQCTRGQIVTFLYRFAG